MYMSHRTLRSLGAAAAAALAVVPLAGRPSSLQAQRAPTAAPTQATPASPVTGEAWQIVPLAQSSLVYARDNSLIGEIGKEQRTVVPMRSLPKYVPQAFVAIEDQRFYQHDGVDVIGVLGAIKGKILNENRGGASTITQQLVGYMHPDIIDRRDISLSRKLREQSAAREMEKHYNKDQILEAYINQINLGRGWYGVEAAARHYFAKPAAKLTLAEAATLAALPKSQPAYDPIRNPLRNKARRDIILTKMAEQGFVTLEAAEAAKLEPVVTAPNFGMSATSNYFVDAVRQQAERAGIPVAKGGYRVYTTLDPVLQRHAVDALVEGTYKVESQQGYRHLTQAQATGRQSDYLQGAVVALDPFTGDVRALVGGRNYARAPFNRVITASRQPGSSIKPIVYAKAIEDSIPGSTIVPDTALEIPVIGDPPIYKPQNVDGKFVGPITMREGLIHSRNTVAIQLGLRVGMDSVAALSQRMGVNSPMLPVPASMIGASEVHPIELVAAYAAFANNGSVVQPRFITHVVDATGRIVLARPPSTPQPALDPRVAFIVRSMMTDVVDRGSGSAARRAVPASIPVAGKTGTTNDNVDVWFVGITPDLVAGVWLGFDKPKTITAGAVGGLLAAPIWGQMVGRYYAGRSVSGWGPPPDGLTYAELDRDSGAPATASTPPDKRYFEFFLEGTEPEPLRNNPWKMPQWGPFIAPTRPWSPPPSFRSLP
jgi:penicillin-binding protein 1A